MRGRGEARAEAAELAVRQRRGGGLEVWLAYVRPAVQMGDGIEHGQAPTSAQRDGDEQRAGKAGQQAHAINIGAGLEFDVILLRAGF